MKFLIQQLVILIQQLKWTLYACTSIIEYKVSTTENMFIIIQIKPTSSFIAIRASLTEIRLSPSVSHRCITFRTACAVWLFIASRTSKFWSVNLPRRESTWRKRNSYSSTREILPSWLASTSTNQLAKSQMAEACFLFRIYLQFIG